VAINFFADLLPENSKQELKIDKNMFEILLHDDVMKFWDEIQNWKIDDGIIDLFSLLDNKISLYLEKWDRTTLILVIMS
jgi:hypothetical protein